MAQWKLLTEYLRTSGDQVRLSYGELSAIVGGLPESATKHRYWWSGNRTQVRAWSSAGYTVSDLVMGREVVFTRAPAAPGSGAAADETLPRPRASAENAAADAEAGAADDPAPDVLLIAPGRATSAAHGPELRPELWPAQRAHAERSGVEWFVLSVERGLVGPDELPLRHERRLLDTPASYRSAWGRWVAERLALHTGSLHRKTVEVHAADDHIAALHPHLRAKGAVVVAPLIGLTPAKQLAWYSTREALRSRR